MQQKTVNVNGRKVNKLEEIVRLLAKLNEETYSKEELEVRGYPITYTMKADGSGILGDVDLLMVLYRFESIEGLEQFLKSNSSKRILMIRNEKEKS